MLEENDTKTKKKRGVVSVNEYDNSYVRHPKGNVLQYFATNKGNVRNTLNLIYKKE